MTDADEIRGLEESHLRADVRSSPDALGALLADDFVEFGSSGRVLDRASILASVARGPAFTWSMEDFVARALAGDAVLTRYRLAVRTAGGETSSTLRSSVWVRREGRWRLVFHQGTVAA